MVSRGVEHDRRITGPDKPGREFENSRNGRTLGIDNPPTDAPDGLTQPRRVAVICAEIIGALPSVAFVVSSKTVVVTF